MSEDAPATYEQKAQADGSWPPLLIREAMLEMLAGIGIDASRPTELQADLYYLRRQRRAAEEGRSVLRHAFLTITASALLALLWHAVKNEIVR